MMENLIVIGILVLLIGAAVLYLRGQKRRGVKCVGCPHAKCCRGKCK